MADDALALSMTRHTRGSDVHCLSSHSTRATFIAQHFSKNNTCPWHKNCPRTTVQKTLKPADMTTQSQQLNTFHETFIEKRCRFAVDYKAEASVFKNGTAFLWNGNRQLVLKSVYPIST